MEFLSPNLAMKEAGKGLYAISKPVDASNWSEAKRKGHELADWLDEKNGKFEGTYSSGFALSHCQVAEAPLRFFAVAKEMVSKRAAGKANTVNTYFPARVIFNAEILEAPERIEVTMPKREAKRVGHDKIEVETKLVNEMKPNTHEPDEACLSFPQRKKKTFKRFFRIKVRYEIAGFFGQRKVVEEWVEGLKAHVFQHEIDHANGLVLYYKR